MLGENFCKRDELPEATMTDEEENSLSGKTKQTRQQVL